MTDNKTVNIELSAKLRCELASCEDNHEETNTRILRNMMCG